jgi:uncharacterized protein (DUF952 family)
MNVFKIVTIPQWKQASVSRHFFGTAEEVRTRYIHLSTGCQLPGTLQRKWPGQRSNLMLMCVNLNNSDHITWERGYPRLWTSILISPPWEPKQPYLEWVEHMSNITFDDGMIIVHKWDDL